MLKPAGKFAARVLERWLSGEYRSLEMIKLSPGNPDPAPETELSCQELQKSQEVYYLAPAFYDLQVNGYDGVMLDEEITWEGCRVFGRSSICFLHPMHTPSPLACTIFPA